MNLLRSLLKPFDRRTVDQGVSVERRGNLATRLNAATDRVDSAIDDLCKTVSMSRTDFNAMIERDRVRDVIDFAGFAGKCEFRHVNGGTEAMCTNPEHEKICTGLEVCGAAACPRLRKPE